MKRRAWLLALLILFSCVVLASADTGKVTIPASTTAIEAEAFCSVGSVTTVEIPDSVVSIGSRAFADCAALKAVYLPSGAVSIAPDAFEGSKNVVLYVKDQSPAYVFAVANGFAYELVGNAASFLERSAELTAATGKPAGAYQSGQFALKRLLVRMESSSTRLPPIAQFNPTDILYDGDGLYVLQFATPGEANRCNAYLENASGVLYVSEDRYLSSSINSAELNAAGLSSAWNNGDPMGFAEYSAYVKENYTGTVTVAVIDSGVGYNAALDSRVRSDGYDFVDGLYGARYDPVGHGTQIAALILELVGENNVRILPIRAFDADGCITVHGLAVTINYACQKGASIINLSSLVDYDPHVANAINNCGATVIVSAGNANKDCATEFPANQSSVITVGGVAPDGSGGVIRWKDNDAVGSNYGDCVDYAAPATGVIAGSGYSEAYGTSFAAPHIAAAYALLTLDQEHNAADMRETCLEIPGAQLGAGMPVLSELAAEHVTGISLSSPPASVMGVGQYYAGLLKVTPADATNPALAVESSNAAVVNASVTADGILVLTALKPGNATVTVTACDGGGAQLMLDITVVQQVTQINLSHEGDSTLYLDTTRQLYVQVLPATAAQKGVEWSVSPQGAATVTDGLVKPLKEGEVTITATATDGFGATGSVTFNVVERPEPETVEIGGDHRTLNIGDIVQLTVTVLPEEANQAVTWTSSDTTVATIDKNGVLTAEAAGFSIIEAEAVNGEHDSILVTVVQPPRSVSISGVSTLNVGQTATLTATVLPADATDRTVAWSSSNTAVATVDAATGVVTAVSRGEVTITATCNADATVAAGWTMTIRQPVIGIAISGTTTLTEGATTRLSAVVSPANANDASLTWASSDEGVAKVDANGVVTAVAPGTASITARAQDGSGVSSNPLTITVKPQTFTVTFNANGGSCATASMTATRTVALGTLPVPTRDYYNFTGWYTAASGGTQVTSATAYSVASNVTLYAQWSGKPYTITFTNGSSTQTLTGYVDEPIGTLPTASRDSYTFTGWYMADGTKLTADYTQSVVKDFSVTAKFSPKPYTLYFDANGGVCAETSRTCYVDTAIGELPVPTRDYYTFQGWYLPLVGVKVTSSYTLPSNDSNLILEAHWSENPLSEWILPDGVPEDARVVNTKWTYTEVVESIEGVPEGEGWTATPVEWTQVGEGSMRYAEFTSGFDKSSSLYTKYSGTPLEAYENEDEKRTVTNERVSYIYWHWMYDVDTANGFVNRAIYFKKGTGSSSATGNTYEYKYFEAFESTESCTKQTDKNWNQDDTLYAWYKVYKSGYRSGWFYRTDIYENSYVEYKMMYRYTRECETTTEPTASESITDIVELVQYQLK